MNNKFIIILISIAIITVLISIIPSLNDSNIIKLSDIYIKLNISEKELNTNNYISIMTYNIRFRHLDNNKNIWSNRKNKLINNILKYSPDIFSIQEDTKLQIDDIYNTLKKDYNYIGYMKEAPILSQHNTIFYKKSKFKSIKSTNIHLNEDGTPFKKGWDAWGIRTATITILESISDSNKKYIIANIHLDHMGRTAKKEGMKKLVYELKHKFKNNNNYPIFLMGDFNESPKQYVDQVLLDNNYTEAYIDCINNNNNSCFIGQYHASSFHYYLGYWVDNIFIRSIFYLVFSGYSGKLTDYNRMHIDHLYFKDNNYIKVNTLYFTMPSDDANYNKDGIYASDHYPLYLLFKLDYN